jgi:hypothetical protein
MEKLTQLSFSDNKIMEYAPERSPKIILQTKDDRNKREMYSKDGDSIYCIASSKDKTPIL